MENINIIHGETFERMSGGKKIVMKYERLPEKECTYQGKTGKFFAFGFWEKPIPKSIPKEVIKPEPKEPPAPPSPDYRPIFQKEPKEPEHQGKKHKRF